MNTKHTPGPWHVFRPLKGKYRGDFAIRHHELEPAFVFLPPGREDIQAANAALIAAAPELLEALKGLAAHAHQCAHFGDMKLLERADSVIEKAEGL